MKKTELPIQSKVPIKNGKNSAYALAVCTGGQKWLICLPKSDRN